MNEMASELSMGITASTNRRSATRVASVTTEPRWVQVLLILGALGFLLSFLLLPLLLVFGEALRGGVQAFWAAITDADALAALAPEVTAACRAAARCETARPVRAAR